MWRSYIHYLDCILLYRSSRRNIKEIHTNIVAAASGMGFHPPIQRRPVFVAAFFAKVCRTCRCGQCTAQIQWSRLHRLQRGAFGYCRCRAVLPRAPALPPSVGTACSGCGTKFGENGISHDADDAASRMLRAVIPVAGVIIIVASCPKLTRSPW